MSCSRPLALEAALSDAAPLPAPRSLPEQEKAWNWLLASLADELMALPRAEREALVARLVARAGYACPDFDFAPAMRAHNARVGITIALAARLASEGVGEGLD